MDGKRVAVPRGVAEPREINTLDCLTRPDRPEENQSDSAEVSNRAAGILEYCATNVAAHFGGPHGMFVDVPVAALLELLNSRRDLLAALNSIAEGVTPPEQHGHSLAHREAVRIAREAVRK